MALLAPGEGGRGAQASTVVDEVIQVGVGGAGGVSADVGDGSHLGAPLGRARRKGLDALGRGTGVSGPELVDVPATHDGTE